MMFQNSREDTLFDYTIGRLLGEEALNKTEVTKAFYQSAANVFVVIVGIVAFAMYQVFSAFLRPLLWAVLCGVFLFPIKHRSTHVLNARLRLMQINNTPLWLGIIVLPLHFLAWPGLSYVAGCSVSSVEGHGVHGGPADMCLHSQSLASVRCAATLY